MCSQIIKIKIVYSTENVLDRITNGYFCIRIFQILQHTEDVTCSRFIIITVFKLGRLGNCNFSSTGRMFLVANPPGIRYRVRGWGRVDPKFWARPPLKQKYQTGGRGGLSSAGHRHVPGCIPRLACLRSRGVGPMSWARLS